jgi:L-ascorbate metabolism protein UlaG (beta-lactamase superfamily)
VQYIGNATLLIHYGALTILTDPNLVHRGAEVPMGFGLTTTRLTDPALDVEELPRPDLVIVSHDHGDHFDAVAADWLPAATPIITAPAAAAGMAERGFSDVRGLAAWDSVELEREGTRARVTSVPAQHGPAALAGAMPEVIGTVIELWADAEAGRDAAPDLRLYVSGDTVFHDGLAELRDRFDSLDVAFLHLGGMRLMGMTVTMDAAQGVQAINLLQPRLSIPIHYNDYGTQGSSLADFVFAVNEAGLSDRVRYLRHGDAWALSAAGESSVAPQPAATPA